MITKISTAELRVGMYVEDTGLSWLEHPYLYAEAGEISSVSHIQAILKEGYREAFINTEKGALGRPDDPSADEAVGRALSQGEGPPAEHPPLPLSEELGVAQALYRDSVTFAREFIKSIQAGEDFDYDQSSALVEEMISSLSRNADALISLSKLRQYDEYTYTHSINVAVFSMAYARYLDRPQDYIHALGMAALFHDLGKYLVPGEILNKPGKLSEQEFRVMKRHPLESFQLLREKDVSEEILRGVVEHHERFNGNGYPRGLQGEQQHPFARIIAVADVYDALTSERIYKKAMLPGKALSLMYGLREKDFHPGMVERFIKCLGIYPIGSLVRLSSGEHGVVCSSHAHAPLRPSVIRAFGRDMQPLAGELIDLSSLSPEDLKITDTLDPRPFDIDPLSIIESASA